MKRTDELKEIHRRVDQAVIRGGDVNLVRAIEAMLKSETDEATRRELNLALEQFPFDVNRDDTRGSLGRANQILLL
jgi:hypothetical protein